MSNDLIKIEDLTMMYREDPVLWDISLCIKRNSRTAIIGPNGAGKSTLVKGILNLLKPISGFVEVYDTEIYKTKKFKTKLEEFKKERKEQKSDKLLEEKTFFQSLKDLLSIKKELINVSKSKIDRHIKKRIAYIPQKAEVNWDFPATVLDVVLMGRYAELGWFRRPSKLDKEKALKALDTMQIRELKDRQISQLSGGQKQRVFLARSIVQEADIYIMDEPLQGIDIKTEKLIVDMFMKFQKEGKTIIVVHHNLETVKDYFDHVVMLNKTLIADGPVDKVFTDVNLKRTFNKV